MTEYKLALRQKFNVADLSCRLWFFGFAVVGRRRAAGKTNLYTGDPRISRNFLFDPKNALNDPSNLLFASMFKSFHMDRFLRCKIPKQHNRNRATRGPLLRHLSLRQLAVDGAIAALRERAATQ
jgi:hypothetical protein